MKMMTWEQKLAALDALAGQGRIAMRAPGDWLSSHRIEIKDRSILKGGCGNGPTVEAAVEDEWAYFTERLAQHEYLVLNAHGTPRRAIRWNGFMWEDYPERKSA